MPLKTLLHIRTNVIGTLSIALVSSSATVLLSNWLIVGNQPVVRPGTLLSQAGNANDLLNCETGVYSPVQHSCVDQATFDAEMKRLFSALGLDARPYRK